MLCTLLTIFGKVLSEKVELKAKQKANLQTVWKKERIHKFKQKLKVATLFQSLLNKNENFPLYILRKLLDYI